MKYLKSFESLSELQNIQRYVGDDRPNLTSELKKKIDDIHSGFNKQDVVDIFQEIVDEGIGRVGEVNFYYGIDFNKISERWLGYSQINVKIIIDDEDRLVEYAKIRESIFDRMKSIYNYYVSSWDISQVIVDRYYTRKINITDPSAYEQGEFDGEEILFRSSRIHWITPKNI